ncbi:MAG TPA: DinB family protein [Flavisolibacter sp.]|jgi:hypothetical protein|nr:DinB family protein [Flavisolibacter sp.]
MGTVKTVILFKRINFKKTMKYSVSDGFPYYIELVGDNDYRQLFQSDKNFSLLKSLTEDQAKHRYAPGKWSIKQIIGHITDHERIMIYRSLRFSRRDKNSFARLRPGGIG